MLNITDLKADIRAHNDSVFYRALQPFPFSWDDWGNTNCSREQWEPHIERVKYNYRMEKRVVV